MSIYLIVSICNQPLYRLNLCPVVEFERLRILLISEAVALRRDSEQVRICSESREYLLPGMVGECLVSLPKVLDLKLNDVRCRLLVAIPGKCYPTSVGSSAEFLVEFIFNLLLHLIFWNTIVEIDYCRRDKMVIDVRKVKFVNQPLYLASLD